MSCISIDNLFTGTHMPNTQHLSLIAQHTHTISLPTRHLQHMLLDRGRQLRRLQTLLLVAVSLPLLWRLEDGKLRWHRGFRHEVAGPFLPIFDSLQRDLFGNGEDDELEVDGAEGGSGDVVDAGWGGKVGGPAIGHSVEVGVLGPLQVGVLIVKRVEVPVTRGVWRLEPARGGTSRVGDRGSVAPGIAVADAEGGASDDDVCDAVTCLL